MESISEKLEYLNETKEMIKDAIISTGVDVPAGATFRDYAIQIDAIESSGTLTEKTEIFTKNETRTVYPDEGSYGMSKLNVIAESINTGATSCAKVLNVNVGSGSGSFTLPANKKGYVLMFSTSQNQCTQTCSAGTGTKLYQNGGIYGNNQLVVGHLYQYVINASSSSRTITVSVSGDAMRQTVVIAAY